MKFNIRLKLIAFAFCLVLLVGGSISLYSIYVGRERILTGFEKSAQEITSVISGTIANDLYFLDLRSLRRRLQSARVNPDISYTYVTDQEGVVLTDGTGENALRDQKLNDAFSREILLSSGWVSRVEGEIFKVGGPVFGPDGARLGHLQVGFLLSQAYVAAREMTRTSLYITGICLGVGVLLAVFLATGFSRPILSLAQASREIGEGKLDTRLPVKRRDELGLLAESVNQMAFNLKRNQERIRALHEIDKAISSTLDLHTVLDVLLEKIELSLPYAAATVRLFNRESGLLEPVACRNLDEKEWKSERWRGGRGVPNVVFETKAPVTISNVQSDPQNRDQEFFRKHGLVSYLGVPLIAKGEILGVISFYTKEEHEFSSEEVEFLSTLAGQAAIAIHNARLYEEVREKIQELQKRTAELERANKVKDEFLSVMSHELRTPLNVVMGYTGMIRDGILGEINAEQENALEKVISRARDQLTMITSILQAVQMEAGELVVEEQAVGLGDLLNELKLHYDIPSGKEITLIWDYPVDLPVINSDGDKLKHILKNLINNAIKFTSRGSVTISARPVEKRGGADGQGGRGDSPQRPSSSAPMLSFVEFKVTDTGVGIPEEALPVIFERFHQVDSSETRLYGGVGIGLYIVKRFTEMLGGKVEVESEVGKGSTFTVTIPCESQQAERERRGDSLAGSAGI